MESAPITPPSQKEFAAKNNIAVPFLSDFAKREVSAAYGVLNKDNGVANRATFVIDKDGKITHIDEKPMRHRSDRRD